MSDFDYRRLQDLQEAPGLQAAFEDMYAHFETAGGRPFLGDGAYEAWSANYARLAGRTRLLVAALKDGELAGFAEGMMRAPPPYFAPVVTGFVSHMYVAPGARRGGVAWALYDMLEAWFREKGAKAVELQVLSGNDGADRFWEDLAFRPDNRQMRKLLP